MNRYSLTFLLFFITGQFVFIGQPTLTMHPQEFLYSLADSLQSSTFPEPDSQEGCIRISKDTYLFWKRFPATKIDEQKHPALLLEVRHINTMRPNNFKEQE